MFLLVFAAIILGFLLILLLTATSPQKKQDQLSLATEKTPQSKWTKKEFEDHCISIIEGLGLKISNIYREKEEMMEIYAENPEPLVGGRYIIFAHYEPAEGITFKNNVTTLASMVKHEGATKGIYITTSAFSDDIEELINESPIELIDGIKFEELISMYKIS